MKLRDLQYATFTITCFWRLLLLADAVHIGLSLPNPSAFTHSHKWLCMKCQSGANLLNLAPGFFFPNSCPTVFMKDLVSYHFNQAQTTGHYPSITTKFKSLICQSWTGSTFNARSMPLHFVCSIAVLKYVVLESTPISFWKIKQENIL